MFNVKVDRTGFYAMQVKRIQRYDRNRDGTLEANELRVRSFGATIP